jgi:hypothetical protein
MESIYAEDVLYQFCVGMVPLLGDIAGMLLRYGINVVEVVHQSVQFSLLTSILSFTTFVSILRRYGTNTVEVRHQCCGGIAPMLWRYSTNAVEVRHQCCGGIAPILWRYNTNAVEV